jgi:hypothetical protein
MLKVKLRHLNVLEGELNAASEDALRVSEGGPRLASLLFCVPCRQTLTHTLHTSLPAQVAIPIRADGLEGGRAVLQPAVAKEGQNTEQRWLGKSM